MHRAIWFPWFVFLLACGARVFAEPVLPATNPYAAVVERYRALTMAERAELDAWLRPEEGQAAPVLSAAHQILVNELTSAVVAAASAPPTTPEDWIPAPKGKTTAPDYANIGPSIGDLRNLARLATKVADARPAGEALPTYLAVAQLGRQHSETPTLIGLLGGVAIKGVALAPIARRPAEFARRSCGACRELGMACGRRRVLGR